MNPTQTPTEPGWFYWASSTTNGKWYCEYINQTPAGKLFVQSTLSDVDTTGGFWGGKVPSPGTTWSVGEIDQYLESQRLLPDHIKGIPTIEATQNVALDCAIRSLEGERCGIAATTERNNKEPK